MTIENMRAVIWEGKTFHVSVKSIPKPIIKKPGDAIIQITTSAICGTDLHTFRGILGSTNPPWTMGHEGIGIVTEVGSDVSTIKVGDWVIVPDGPSIGHLELGPPPITSDALVGFGQQFGDLGGLQGSSVVLI
jgi:threonine dehydrogenase-like Zn-dependent dehydrogenase